MSFPLKMCGFCIVIFVPKLKKILKMDSVLPAWGLTAKVNTGTRGGASS